jgi:hypothetical protein
MRRTYLTLAIAIGMMAGVGPVRAQTGIEFDQWYTFRFGEPGTWATEGVGVALGQNSVAAGPPAWTISSVSPFRFFLTDGFQSGDRFSLFNFDALIGSTSVVATGHSCGNDENACLADPLISSAIFDLGPGSYSFTILVEDSPFGAGAAFFRAQQVAVPEPFTLALLPLGLAGVAAAARVRRRGSQVA